ncbi:MAG: hypothetical protein GY856_52985, partial [bacterium]|nr:hypothetical protein [bacterium]
SSEFAFLRNSRTDLDLLARSGTVEWVFRDGVVGYVAGVFRASERFSVAVPAFCKEPGGADGQRPEPHLVLPYFELDRGDPGVTTYFSVRNGTERGVDVKYEYFDAAGQPFGEPEIEYLAAHAARTVDICEVEVVPATDRQTGYVGITAVDPETSASLPDGPILHGEYFRVDLVDNIAGGEVLLDTRPSLSSPELCRLWNVRFFNGGGFEGKSDFIFYVPENTGEAVTVAGRVYDEAGDRVGDDETPDILFEVSTAVFVKSSGELPLGAEFGAIEWEFTGGVGHISAVFKAEGGFWVEIPAICQDRPVEAANR